jgi:RNA polymerase sigma factor (sigma-70 family)
MDKQESEREPYVRPLTHRRPDGTVYQRPPEVDEAIRKAVSLDPAALVTRAQIQDATSEGYLRDEVLVYFAREFGRKRQAEVHELAEALLRRVRRLIRGWARDWVADAYHDGFVADCLNEVFTRIFDLESDRGEYAEVRLGDFLKRRAIEVRRKVIKESRRAVRTRSLSDRDEEGRPSLDIEDDSPSPERLAEGTEAHSIAMRILGQVDDNKRQAFILHYFEGMQIDSDAGVENISEMFGKSEKTIRNWLRQCEGLIREALRAEGVCDGQERKRPRARRRP